MKKFNLLFSIFFVLTLQVAFSSSTTQLEEVGEQLSMDSEHQSQFEENNFSPDIFGEVAPGQIQISVFTPDTECFFSNSKSKNLQVAFLQSALRSKVIQSKTLSFGSACYCIIEIPIYLQTGNFRL